MGGVSNRHCCKLLETIPRQGMRAVWGACHTRRMRGQPLKGQNMVHGRAHANARSAECKPQRLNNVFAPARQMRARKV
eukprot:526736-Pelagomonas_calceolata.AAC.3